MVSIVDKLERLFKKRGFKVERRSRSLRIFGKSGWFSRRDLDMILRTADRYGASVRVGRIIISKKGGSPGQNSVLNRRRRLNAA
jgi:hypothetical protein